MSSQETQQPGDMTSPAIANDSQPEELQDWELTRQLRRAVRIIRIAAAVGITLLALVIFAEVFRFYDLFAQIHWMAGYLYLVLVIAAVAIFVGRPIWRYLRLPRVVAPPDVHLDDENVTAETIAQRAAFVAHFCQSLAKNPELADRGAEIQSAQQHAATLARRAKSATGDQVGQIADELRTFETNTVDPVFEDLDRRVDAYIRKEAVAVGIGTAICLNGTLDAFIVLWRTANMVARIGRFYYGRPGLRGSLMILRDVAKAVVLSRATDDVADLAGELVVGLPGRLGGTVAAIPGINIVAGPVVDGTVNTLMVMRVGYLAKGRCRSFEAWNRKAAHRVVVGVLHRVSTEATGVAQELFSQVGGFGLRAANTAVKLAASTAKSGASSVVTAAGTGADALLGGGKNAWDLLRSVFGGKEKPETGSAT